MTQNTPYSGLVWIISGVLLLIYGALGLTQTNIPGVEELVVFINAAEGSWLFLAAFAAIFIEGLYVIGSFFPGTSLVLLITIAAQLHGILSFLFIIITIYIGWTLAGLINIFGARFLAKPLHINTNNAELADKPEFTWFPAFRANTEVAQITEGNSVWQVIRATTRIKTITMLLAIPYTLIVPLLLDLENRTNEEGFWSLAVIAIINFSVGGYKIYQYKTQTAVKPQAQ